MLIGQAGSIGGTTRQEIKDGAMRTGECWEGGSPFFRSPAQTKEEAGCDLPPLKKVLSHMTNIDQTNGLK